MLYFCLSLLRFFFQYVQMDNSFLMDNVWTARGTVYTVNIVTSWQGDVITGVQLNGQEIFVIVSTHGYSHII